MKGNLFLTVSQVAARYGVHAVTVRRWLRSGVLQGIRIGERGHWHVAVPASGHASAERSYDSGSVK